MAIKPIDDFGREMPDALVRVNQASRNSELIKARQLFDHVFNSPEGREVLKDLQAKFHEITSFAPGDPHRTAFNEGRRSVVLYIMQRLERYTPHEGLDGESA